VVGWINRFRRWRFGRRPTANVTVLPRPARRDVQYEDLVRRQAAYERDRANAWHPSPSEIENMLLRTGRSWNEFWADVRLAMNQLSR
jgi:hypothetical protein